MPFPTINISLFLFRASLPFTMLAREMCCVIKHLLFHVRLSRLLETFSVGSNFLSCVYSVLKRATSKNAKRRGGPGDAEISTVGE